MSLNSGILGSVSLVQESTLGGSTTGSIYAIRGFREWEYDLESPQRVIRTNVWRLSGPQANVARYFSGRMDMILAPSPVLELILRSIMTTKSYVAAGTSTLVVRAERGELPAVAGLKFLAAFENGPWLTFNGVVIEGFRMQFRARELPRISIDWRALSLTEVAVDPSWSIVSPDYAPIAPTGVVVELDTVALNQITEVGFELTAPIEPVSTRNGIATGFRRGTPWQCTGSLSELFDSSPNIPELIRSNTEAHLNVTCTAVDPTYSLEIDLPRVMFEVGAPDPVNKEDARGAYTYRPIHESALDTADEPLLTTVGPI